MSLFTIVPLTEQAPFPRAAVLAGHVHKDSGMSSFIPAGPIAETRRQLLHTRGNKEAQSQVMNCMESDRSGNGCTHQYRPSQAPPRRVGRRALRRQCWKWICLSAGGSCGAAGVSRPSPEPSVEPWVSAVSVQEPSGFELQDYLQQAGEALVNIIPAHAIE